MAGSEQAGEKKSKLQFQKRKNLQCLIEMKESKTRMKNKDSGLNTPWDHRIPEVEI